MSPYSSRQRLRCNGGHTSAYGRWPKTAPGDERSRLRRGDAPHASSVPWAACPIRRLQGNRRFQIRLWGAASFSSSTCLEQSSPRSRSLSDLAFDGRSGLQLAGALLNGAHDAKQIAAINLFDVGSRIACLKQRTSEHRELVVGAKLRGHTTHSVEVRADADMVDAANLHRMVDLRDNVG